MFWNSAVETSPKPRILEEEEIILLGAGVEFEEYRFNDYGNTLNYFWESKHRAPPSPPVPLEQVFLKMTTKEPRFNPSKQWLMEKNCPSEAFQIFSPPTTIPCLIRGSALEALHDPTVDSNIMLYYLADTIFGNMPLAPTDKLFKSPLGFIFESHQIARAVRCPNLRFI